MLLAHRNPRWRIIKDALTNEFLFSAGIKESRNRAGIDWMAEHYNFKYYEDDNGYWYATEIPDDIYTMLVLKYVK